MIFQTAEAVEALGYNFKDDKLLRQCFTHASYANEHNGIKDNERLEFLGDSVLGLIVSEYLYTTKSESEGLMTDDKQKIVSKKPLSEATRRLGLDKFLLVGGDRQKAVQLTDSLCENLYESCVAGIYLDGGYESAKAFVIRTLINVKTKKVEVKPLISDKNLLQEYLDKRKLEKPVYKLLKKTGVDHLPIFVVEVSVEGQSLARGEGGSKKQAEQQAAKKALASLKNKNRKVKK